MSWWTKFLTALVELFLKTKPLQIEEDKEPEQVPDAGVPELVEAEPPVKDMSIKLPEDFAINTDYMIPVASGQAVGKGWTSYSDRKALGVTWHWTATWDLKTCTRILGGADALRKGEASCHYGIGRTIEEGVHQYVSLENRSWHAGAGQTKCYDGSKLKSRNYTGARNTIGIETVHIGYTRERVPRLDGYYDVGTQNGRVITVAPWTEEQILLMIHIGKVIVERWPDIGPRDHHGHHDICPGRKTDVCGFPFARVLQGIYDDPNIPDVWSEFWDIAARQQALIDLGYDLGSYGADGDWGRMSDAALEKFQEANDMFADGMWDTYTCWKVHDLRNSNVS